MRSSTIRFSVRLQELRSSRAQSGFSTQSINNRKKNTMEIKRLRLTDLEINRGQVPGLPSNPREWSRTDLDKLIKSIKDTPELLEARGPIVWPYEGKYIILGGNMRFSALREMNAVDAPCIVMPKDTPTEKLREIVIKDNGQFGSWDYDMLANEWDDLPLCEMGVPAWETDTPKNVSSGLPEELQEIDLMPDDLPDLEGDNETAMARIIIVFPKDRAGDLAQVLGLEEIDKVLYKITDIPIL